MRVEGYSEKYYADIVKLISNFYEESLKYVNIGLDKDRLAETVLKVSESGKVFLLIVNDKCEGVLAGFEAPSMLNTKRIFQELIWYVNAPFRKYGVKLIKHAQETMKAEGFNVMIMAFMHNSKADKLMRLYERMGFKPFETHCIKELG